MGPELKIYNFFFGKTAEVRFQKILEMIDYRDSDTVVEEQQNLLSSMMKYAAYRRDGDLEDCFREKLKEVMAKSE
jgi:hypothetical protein